MNEVLLGAFAPIKGASTVYRVEMTERATRDLRLLPVAVRAHESEPAARWRNGLQRPMKKLGASPHRCPIAPESKPKRIVRQLLYGRKPRVDRILYSVAEEESTVFILHIRQGARLSAES